MTSTVIGPRVPGSEHIPFKPINPWGRKAKMPEGWVSPLERRVYQLYVDDKDKGTIAICPRMQRPIVEEWLAALKIAIKTGKITGWSNPHIRAAPLERAVSRLF
jgi:hypothetical protein